MSILIWWQEIRVTHVSIITYKEKGDTEIKELCTDHAMLSLLLPQYRGPYSLQTQQPTGSSVNHLSFCFIQISESGETNSECQVSWFHSINFKW